MSVAQRFDWDTFTLGFSKPGFTARQIGTQMNNAVFDNYSIIPKAPGGAGQIGYNVQFDIGPLSSGFGQDCGKTCAGDVTPPEQLQCPINPQTNIPTNYLYQIASNSSEPGTGVQSYWCACNLDLLASCGILNTGKTCTLGTRGTGVCRTGTCPQNTDWGVLYPNRTDPNTGELNPNNDKQIWIFCTYVYPFDNTYIGTIYGGNDLGKFTGWLTDILAVIGKITGVSANIPFDYIRDTHVVHGFVFDMYNQLYNTGFYASNTATNPFTTVNFFGPTVFKNYVSTAKNAYYTAGTTPITAMYYNNTIDVDVDKIINACVSLPFPQYHTDTNTYTLSFCVNYDQYQTIATADDKNTIVNGLLSGLFRDNAGSITNGNSVISVPEMGIVLQQYQQLVWSEADGTTSIVPNTWVQPPVPPTGKSFFFFLVGTITVQIQKWTPMLYMYFAMNGVNMAPACSVFTQQTELIPSSSACFPGCSNKTACSSLLSANCTLNYTPPPYYTQPKDAPFPFLTSDSAYCRCFNSSLQPANDMISGNPSAMCFDTNCPVDMQGTFGLTNQACASTCSTMGGWVTNEDPALQSASFASFNSDKFDSLCGPIITGAETERKINWQVLVTGLVSTVLISVLMFSIGKHAEFTGLGLWACVIGVFLLFIGLSIFAGFDMNGVAELHRNGTKIEFECKSKITHVKIPDQFCTRVLDTQCMQDSDCNTTEDNTCFCAEGSCLAKAGTQTFTEKNVNLPNYPMIIVCLVIFVTVPLALVYLYRDYHFPIDSRVFAILVVGISVLSLVLLVFFVFTKGKKRTYDNPC